MCDGGRMSRRGGFDRPDGMGMDHDRGGAELEELWQQHSGRAYDVAYRLLGSVHDAEDVVQDAYGRLVGVDLAEIYDVRGWLVTVTSRLCIDRLRAHEHSRRAYVGPWLPEPIVQLADPSPDVADQITLDESVQMALLVVLQQLSPAERTAFVLHDVFGLEFAEIGGIVGRSSDACRQLAHRARRRVSGASKDHRYAVDRAEHEALARRFAAACATGDLEGLLAVLDPAVRGDFDSGGLVANAPLQTLRGAGEVAGQLIQAFEGVETRFSVTDVNGAPGVIVTLHGRVVAVIALAVSHGAINLIHAIGSPHKLSHLNRQQGEREADADLAAGRGETFNSGEDFLDALRARAKPAVRRRKR